MPRKILNNFLPKHEKIKDNKFLKLLGDKINHPKVLGRDRKSVALAFAIGLFVAFIPMPFQMVLSSFLAVSLRANIVISVSLVWITNPFTMPPIYYIEYLIGSLILKDENSFFELDIDWISEHWNDIFINLYVGAFTTSIFFGLLGYILINILWKIKLLRNKKK
jgi:hypothetical protein